MSNKHRKEERKISPLLILSGSLAFLAMAGKYI